MAEPELLPAFDPHEPVAPPVLHPAAQTLYAYWRGKGAPGRLPGRAEVDPLEMKAALGCLALIEVHRAPLRFRYRLHGAKLAALDGFDLTGKWLDEHPAPEPRRRIHSSWSRAAEQGLVIHGFRPCLDDIRPRRYEILVLPLADDGATVDKLLVFQALIED